MRLSTVSEVRPRPLTYAAEWPGFVVAALVFTLTAGALTGALDLWTLRVAQSPVPLDHHRAHGVAQLFGFLGLFTMGVSLHLAPRLFGVAPPERGLIRLLKWSAVGGVFLVVVGRLGALVPGSTWLGLVGAGLVVVAQTTWASMLWTFWRDLRGPHETMHRFLLAGVGWWWLAAVTLLGWQVGQTFGGVATAVQLESVWAPAAFGGVASWVWGIFFRAGICTLHVRRPSEKAQQRLWLAWQGAVALAVLATWVQVAWLDAVVSVALVAAVGLVWWTVRPFSGEGLAEEEGLQARAVQAGLVFLGVFAALQGWSALGEAGVWTPVLIRDASRHAYTLGGMTLLLVGFAGRMVPGFRGTRLKWPRAYDAGVVALGLGAAMRLGELAGTKLTMAFAGASGGLAFGGLVLVAASLLGSLRRAG